MEKELTSSGNVDTPPTSSQPKDGMHDDDTLYTSSSKPKDIIHDDVCSICFDDVSILDPKTFRLGSCCGKVMHEKCSNQFSASVVRGEMSCPMCRAPWVAGGSKEEIARLQRWSQHNKAWAQFNLGNSYYRGCGT